VADRVAACNDYQETDKQEILPPTNRAFFMNRTYLHCPALVRSK
jgi:hypothetical protein